MTVRQTILVIDDDPAIIAGLEMLLDGDGRVLILCPDLESAELMLARHPVTHVLSDVQFSGRLGYEGLHFLTRIRAQRPGCRIVLMTGMVSDTLCAEAEQLGAATVLAKPFELHELEQALGLEGRSAGPTEILRVPPLDEILHGGLLSTAFQPIVTPDLAIFGFEALARIGGAWADGGISDLFEYASKRRQLAELNVAALKSAVSRAGLLPSGTLLFMNVDPTTFHYPGFVETLVAATAEHGLPLSRIVLEITERSAFADADTALHVLDRLYDMGVRFALDDHGSAYSHLSLIDRIRPSFFKISQTFGTAFEEDPMKTRVVRHIAAMAHDFGCLTILEGIESASTALAAVAHDVDLVQGYYFGRPREASCWTDARRVAA